ncbi:NAD+ synthase [Streptomonospora sp. NEAU-YY374]|nr:NAD+ synthase [Streptomonospora nanhaiensis]
MTINCCPPCYISVTYFRCVNEFATLPCVVQLRIALAQVNPTVGDLEGNCDSVVAYSRRANDAGAHLVVFPEMVVTGYSVEDLALRNGFVSASIKATHGLARRLEAEGLGHLPVIVGYLSRREGLGERFGQPPGAPQNSLALLHHGELRLVSAKYHLPNYGVFDEARYFVPGDTLPVVRLHGADIAFAICEDLWQDGGPVSTVRAAGAGMLITLNGSPYERAKDDIRLELCQRRAREIGAAVGYVNMTGAQDELVFEGDSFIVDSDGELVARAPQFDDALLVTDIDLPRAKDTAALPAEVGGFRIVRHTVSEEPPAAYEPLTPVLTPRRSPTDDRAEVYTALVTSLRDYARKNGFASVMVGVSGGIDSALTATIAVDALGAENVHGVVMPGRSTTAQEIQDAEDLIRRQGINGRTVSVKPMVDAYETAAGLGRAGERDLESRVRGNVLMALSNEGGHLVLATGDKTALATGEGSLYGDSVGGFAPLKDCWKTQVRDLARWRNEAAAKEGGASPIPANSFDRAVEGDWPGLPDPDVVDSLLDAYIGTDRGQAELIADGFEAELVKNVVSLVDRAEFSRRQYPPGPKISKRNLGRDRRLPITNRWT